MTELRIVGREGPVDLVDVPDSALSMLARDGHAEATVEQERRRAQRRDPDTISRHNPNHDEKGKFSAAPGGGGTIATGDSGSAHGVVKILADGRSASCTAEQVGPLLSHMVSAPSVNLANLQVQGAGNENLFSNHIREIPRAEMPQLPETAAGLKPFADKLAGMGVTAELREVDPRELKATQNQLDSKMVGKLFGFMSNGGWRANSVIVTSKEDAVLDGHHRWASASAVAATGPFKINALRVGLGIDDLLKVAHEFSGPRKAMGVA